MEQGKKYSDIHATAPKNRMTMDDNVRQYVNEHNPLLYILTPCYGGSCFVNYVQCLMQTIELCKHFYIELKVEFCKNDSLVTRARNNLVARALSNPKTTHVLFIDADITWDPSDILKLLISNKEVIGGVYPLKQYNWDNLVNKSNQRAPNMVETWVNKKNQSQLKDTMSDSDIIQYNMVNYNVNYLDKCMTIDDNLAKVKHLATGFMMIQRVAFDKMFKAYPDTKYIDDISFLKPEENKYAYALFDTAVNEGRYLSEDWVFCQRYTALKNAVYIDVSIMLTHTGICDYKGAYISSIL